MQKRLLRTPRSLTRQTVGPCPPGDRRRESEQDAGEQEASVRGTGVTS